MKGYTVRTDDNEPGWQDKAACRNHDPEWWFPAGRHHGTDPWRIARTVCVRCPVIDSCLRHVLANPEADGMWAALTPDERTALTRRGLAVAS